MLGAARQKAADARQLLTTGVDPSQARQQKKQSVAKQRQIEQLVEAGLPVPESFEAVAREWFGKHAPTWATSHSDKIIRRLERDVFPWIGSCPRTCWSCCAATKAVAPSRRPYREARLQDEHRFDEWESLWTDDAVYSVPANGEDIDPERDMSILYDNRSRIALRMRQFHTGKRYSQLPQSRLRRVVGNIEVLGDEENGTRVTANMLLYESHRRGQIMWAARNEYLLRQVDEVDGQWRLAFKKVALMNNDTPLTTMAFLI